MQCVLIACARATVDATTITSNKCVEEKCCMLRLTEHKRLLVAMLNSVILPLLVSFKKLSCDWFGCGTENTAHEEICVVLVLGRMFVLGESFNLFSSSFDFTRLCLLCSESIGC